MSTAKNLHVPLTKDDLIQARKEGQKNREQRLSTANSKGRKVGFLGAEYAQRQNSQYLRQFSSEDIMAALMEAGMVTAWKDDQRGIVFAFVDEDGNVPDEFPLPSVTNVEAAVREHLTPLEADVARKTKK